jgi:hypothetical protein
MKIKAWSPDMKARGVLVLRSVLALKGTPDVQWESGPERANLWVFDAKSVATLHPLPRHITGVVLGDVGNGVEIPKSYVRFGLPFKHQEVWEWLLEWEKKKAVAEVERVPFAPTRQPEDFMDTRVPSRYQGLRLHLTQWPDMSQYNHGGTINDGCQLSMVVMRLLQGWRTYEQIVTKIENQAMLDRMLLGAEKEGLLVKMENNSQEMKQAEKVAVATTAPLRKEKTGFLLRFVSLWKGRS